MKYVLFMLVIYIVSYLTIELVDSIKINIKMYKKYRQEGKGRLYSFLKCTELIP